MPLVAVEKPLQEKLGNEASASLIRLINLSQTEQKKDILEFVEEKFERRLSEEISGLKSSLLEKITDTRAELMTHISQTREELMEQIYKTREEMITYSAKTKADLIKWMFIFWAGQVGIILGMLFAFFK